MATEKIQLSTVLPASPEDVYAAWLDGKKHSAFTGGGATAKAKAGTRHTAWDNYIHGWTLELKPGKRIVQSWRTVDFKPEDPDSVIEVRLAKAKGGTQITLVHSDIPDGEGAKYEQGWLEHYFAPMTVYFAAHAAKRKLSPGKPAKKAARKPAKKK